MALMDMTTITPLLRALAQLIKPGGRFVFAVPHPSFNSNATRLALEEEDRGGELHETRSVRVNAYLQIPPGKGMGMPGEPNPHYYFHRPLHELLGACFAAGFALDGLEEPAFSADDVGTRSLSWLNFSRFHRYSPPALIAAHLIRANRRSYANDRRCFLFNSCADLLPVLEYRKEIALRA